MKLIYTLILLLFSSSVFAEFLYVRSSISDLLDYGFVIKQIDTVGYATYVYHLQADDDLAICFIMGGVAFCKIETQDKSLITYLNLMEHLSNNEDGYLEELSIEDIERDKELLAEEMDD